MSKELNGAVFEAEVLKSEAPVVVDFWASWCGPCQMLAPHLERIAEQYPSVKFCKANVDENPGLAIRYGIDAIPCLILFREGKIDRRVEGDMPEEMLIERLGL